MQAGSGTNLLAVLSFLPRVTAVGETDSQKHQILRLCSPDIRQYGNVPDTWAAKCHKIYIDIIPQALKLVNSYLINKIIHISKNGFYLIKHILRSNDWENR